MAKNSPVTVSIVLTNREVQAIERCRRRAEARAGLVSRSEIVRYLLNAAVDGIERGTTSGGWLGLPDEAEQMSR